MYNAEYFFVDNPLNRYTLSSRNELKPNADGSTDLYIQKDSPGSGKESNWLPAPPELQTGLGSGVKKFSLVWVFEKPDAIAKFVDAGFEIGGQTSAGAKAGEKGAAFQDALAIAPGGWLYQLTETGVALELTVKGTKYYKDDDLNG